MTSTRSDSDYAYSAVLSLGGNIGDTDAYIADALSYLDTHGVHIDGLSRVYTTAPWGGVEQQDFHNVTVLASTDLSPHELLAQCQEAEQQAHRVRDVRWGPRTLDVDIIAMSATSGEEIVLQDPDLEVPHPRAHQRAFVLIPWREADPQATLKGRAITEYVDMLEPAELEGVVSNGYLKWGKHETD